MRFELEGGPVDGVRDDAPDGITMIYLTDIGPATGGIDPFFGKSLGQMSYELTDRQTEDGEIIFKYIGSYSPDSDSNRAPRKSAQWRPFSGESGAGEAPSSV